MSRKGKIFLGILTAWPLVYIFLFMAFVFSMMILGPLAAEGGGEGPGALFAGGFGLIFIGHIGTMLLQFGLLGYFLYHVFTRDDLEQNTQLLWGLLVFMGGPIGQIIYWWKEIWNGEPAEPTGVGTAGADDVPGPMDYGGRDGRL